MSIHQLTTLAGTASKPYLLRGNQQVTDQIHYGAAPAAGGSRAGGGLAGPGRGGGDGTDSFGEKTSPSGYSGWRNQPQVLGQRLGVVKLFFFSFARERRRGCWESCGQVVDAVGSPSAPCPWWVLGGDRLRRKKKGFHALQVVSPGEKGQSAKTLSSSHPPAFGEKAVPALEGRDIFLCPSSPYKASSEVLPLVRLSLSSENVKRKF